MGRDFKMLMVEELVNRYEKEKIFFLIDYRGLKATQADQLRRELREVNARMNVVKNSLLGRAFERLGIKGFKEHLLGMNALIYGGDPVMTAKKIISYREQNKVLKIKCGFVEGSFFEAQKVEELGRLPSKEELLGRVLSGMVSPLRGFVCILNAVVVKFIRVLVAIKERQAG
jgi:ribosomal protein L10